MQTLLLLRKREGRHLALRFLAPPDRVDQTIHQVELLDGSALLLLSPVRPCGARDRWPSLPIPVRPELISKRSRFVSYASAKRGGISREENTISIVRPAETPFSIKFLFLFLFPRYTGPTYILLCSSTDIYISDSLMATHFRPTHSLAGYKKTCIFFER